MTKLRLRIIILKLKKKSHGTSKCMQKLRRVYVFCYMQMLNLDCRFLFNLYIDLIATEYRVIIKIQRATNTKNTMYVVNM